MNKNELLRDIFKKYGRHPQFLGEEIVDVNQAGGFDDTLLHLAARKGEIEDVKLLVACGADVNAVGDMGCTPLHEAAVRGQVEVVAFLLENGADPGIKNEFGKTAVDWARDEKHDAVVRLLQACDGE